jgi:uncharacterized protein (TIGR03437 family)
LIARNRLALVALFLLLTLFTIPGVSPGLTPSASFFSVSARAATFNSIAITSASSYSALITPSSIAVCFGQFVTAGNKTHAASSLQLPLALGGISIFVDNQPAGLFFAGPTQINFAVPSGVGEGMKRVEVTDADGKHSEIEVPVARVAPGLFSARSDGHGTAAAQTTFDGVTYQNVSNSDGTQREVQPGSPQLTNVLVLYGTGWRNAPRSDVRVKINNIPSRVVYAGQAPGYVGLDQANVHIPWQLSGCGSAEVIMTAGGQTANIVTIKIGGPRITLPVSAIALGQTINGDLAASDPVQSSTFDAGRIRYYDAFRFTTFSPNTGVSIDLRSSQFDAAVNLFKVKGDVLEPVSSDDFTGGLGNGEFVNKNALLLTLLTDPGEYVLFASTSDDNSEGSGQYSLTLKTAPMQQTDYSLTPLDGNIGTTDIQTSGGDYLKVYWFRGLAGQKVRAVMRSSSFDSFLLLYRNSGLYLMSDDQSGGGNDASLEYVLPADGIYLVLATPFAPNRTGSYTLTLSLAN